MRDYQASIEKLRKGAAEAGLIRDLATDTTKRELYNRLHEHLSRLADEIEGLGCWHFAEIKRLYHWSLLSLRFPQWRSFRSGLNTRSRCRWITRSVAARAKNSG